MNNKLTYEYLIIKKFSKKHLEISYRTLNHYDENHILLSDRVSTANWRKFNTFEFIWIKIILKLREIGYSINKTQTLKEKIFIEGIKGSIDKANFINKSFYQEIIDCINNEYDLYLLIFLDGNYTFHDSTSINQWQNDIYKKEAHINIPLKKIITEAIKKEC